MVKDYKRLHNSEVFEKNSNSNYESDEAYSDYVNEKELAKERVNKIEELESNLLPGNVFVMVACLHKLGCLTVRCFQV